MPLDNLSILDKKINANYNECNYIKYSDGRCEIYGVASSTTTSRVTIQFPFPVYNYSITVSANGNNTSGKDMCEYINENSIKVDFLFLNVQDMPMLSKYSCSWRLIGTWK